MSFLDRTTLSYFFLAISIFVISQSMFTLLAKPLVGRMELNRRMKLILAQDSREEVFVELMKSRGLTAAGTLRYPLVRGFNKLVLQSGITIGLEYVLLSMLGLGVVLTLFFDIYLRFDTLLAVPAGMILGLVLSIMYLLLRRKRRKAAFAQQLPEALELIVRSLKAGHPLSIALALAAREISDPLGSEFGIMTDEMAYGATLSKAMRNLEARVGQEDLSILATGVIIQSDVGGNLIELVSTMASLLRERVKMRRKVQALTSEGRVSGNVLTALPILVFLAIHLLTPSYYGDLWGNPKITLWLTIGGVWMCIGNYVIYRLVNFKY